MTEHIPVLLTKVLEVLSPKDGAVYFDGTFGGGGYSKAILEAANCRVIATDRDEHVKNIANHMGKAYGDRFSFYHSKFSEIKSILSHEKISGVDAIILDLGVSNFQLQDADRGFSFKQEGPLDMGMGLCETTALGVIKKYSETDLADIIYKFGEEPFSRRIAKNIKLHLKEIHTTLNLAEVIHRAVGKRGKIDSATKTFQALRIYVNDELGELQKMLQNAVDVLTHNGKIIVVSFHSLEDRIVKVFFKNLVLQNDRTKYKLYSKKPITPSETEVQFNPKARSAKLRCIEKL